MEFLTRDQIERLLANAREQRAAAALDAGALDFPPVVKLFIPDARCTWLLTELDADLDRAFGLCDLGFGAPELGYVSLRDLNSVRGKLGLRVESDQRFDADKGLSAYAAEALRRGHIVS
jgi:hypothetical protein